MTQQQAHYPPLSHREHEVLELVKAGMSTRQIAGQLYISVATARNHCAALMQKLGVHSRLEVAALARGELHLTADTAQEPYDDTADRVIAWILSQGIPLTMSQGAKIRSVFVTLK